MRNTPPRRAGVAWPPCYRTSRDGSVAGVYAFVDTETTGLPLGGVQPRIVSIAWIVADRFDRPRATKEAIVRPDGFAIPVAATAIHGITTAQATRDGRALAEVLTEFAADLAGFGVRGIVAHNLGYDRPVIDAEYARLGKASPLAALDGLCTMRAARRAWPGEGSSLGAVHQRLFGTPVQGAHDAGADCRACCRIFFSLDPGVRIADPPFDAARLAADAARIARVLDFAVGEPGFDQREFVESLRDWVGRGKMLTAKQRIALDRTMDRCDIA